MLGIVSYIGMINLKNSYFTHAELKRALKKFKAERDDVQQPLVCVCVVLKFSFTILSCIY